MKAATHRIAAEQQGHQTEPCARRYGRVNAIAGLYQQRRVMADNHGEQRQKEQRRLWVQAIGDKALTKRLRGAHAVLVADLLVG